MSYPSSSSISSGSLTTTDPPHPLTQLTRMVSVHIHPRLAHWTSLIGEGLVVHRSTRRNVSSRSRKTSRSQGTKVGRFVDETERARAAGRVLVNVELRTEVKSELSLLSRTFLMERFAGMRSCAGAVAGCAGCLEALSGVLGLEIDSKMRWNLRFFDSMA